jgi:hypothetical protein
VFAHIRLTQMGHVTAELQILNNKIERMPAASETNPVRV